MAQVTRLRHAERQIRIPIRINHLLLVEFPRYHHSRQRLDCLVWLGLLGRGRECYRRVSCFLCPQDYRFE
jgi:hypothetical protein